jgi:hypothetical protein
MFQKTNKLSKYQNQILTNNNNELVNFNQILKSIKYHANSFKKIM